MRFLDETSFENIYNLHQKMFILICSSGKRTQNLIIILSVVVGQSLFHLYCTCISFHQNIL